MRGKVVGFGVFVGAEGITPAHAGKSLETVETKGEQKDHPCSCGEKSLTTTAANGNLGSPLLMRGKVVRNTVVEIDHGITPAHAGKSCALSQQRAAEKDHPCSCGEKALFRRCAVFSAGSPLLMRGKGSIQPDFPVKSRITPAHAGKR